MSEQNSKERSVWREIEEREVRPKALEHGQVLLQQLRNVLSKQVEAEQKHLIEARQKLDRLKYGGGR